MTKKLMIIIRRRYVKYTYIDIYIYTYIFQSHGMGIVWSVSSPCFFPAIGLISVWSEFARLGCSSVLAKPIIKSLWSEATLHGGVHPRTKSHRRVLGWENGARVRNSIPFPSCILIGPKLYHVIPRLVFLDGISRCNAHSECRTTFFTRVSSKHLTRASDVFEVLRQTEFVWWLSDSSTVALPLHP